MDCREIRRLLSDNSGRTVPPDEQARIDEHLRQCRQCSAFAIEIDRTVRLLQDLDEIEPPAGLTGKIMQKIRTEAAPKKSWFDMLFFPLHIKLPLEALATLLITVAAVLVYKSMGPELQKIEVQPQAPAVRTIPAAPEKELQKPEIREKRIQLPQLLQEEAKHKDNADRTETRELTTMKEEKPVEQYAPAPAAAPTMPAPSSSFAPSPALSAAARHAETGKAAGMAAGDEGMQRAAPAAPRSELSAEKRAAGLATITLTVRVLRDAGNKIGTYISGIRGEFRIMEQTESRMIMTVVIDPSESVRFFEHLGSLGTIKERSTLPEEISSFKLIIEQQ